MKNLRKNNKRRAGIRSQRFIDIVSDKLATSASSYQSIFFYNNKQLLPSLDAADHRLVRMRQIKVVFSPTEASLGITLQQVGVQLAVIDPVTSETVPFTKMMTLSETNPRSLSINIPEDFGRWWFSDDGTKRLVVNVFNIASVSNATDFTVTIESHYDIALPNPVPV